MRQSVVALIVLIPATLACASCARGERPGADQIEYSSTGGSGSGVGGSGPRPDGGGVCGNGVIEPGEDCDQGDLGGRTCMTEGFGSGGLLCSPLCIFDTSNCSACGNGMLDVGEECDGLDFGGKTSCADLGAGSASEPLSCTDTCQFDLGNCSGCGDGVITAPEDCEPGYGPNGKPDLGGKTCSSLGFDGGELDCSKSCRFNLNGCYTCGDATRNGIEQCDGADFGGKGCNDFPSATGDPYASGTLSCTSNCTIDTSFCMLCGDGRITGNEVCDSGDLNGHDCISEGFTGGVLQCAVGCKKFDTSKCTLCGNNTVEGSEQCDGQNLHNQTCTSLGFTGGGALSCSTECKFDTSGCANNSCGDGVVNGNDQCDCGDAGTPCTSAQLKGKSCSDFMSPANKPYTGGTLKCFSPNNCQVDVSGCTWCGDAVRNGSEACDGGDLGGQSCVGLGYASGSLKCRPDCTYDKSGCLAVPNPLVVCRNPNLHIPDNNLNGAVDTLTISSLGTITDVNLRIKVTHSWVGDVYVELSHGGVTRAVIDQPGVPGSTYGCDGNDIDATLDDEASATAEAACNASPPALAGLLRPNESLSAFDGQSMSGTWQIHAADLAVYLDGTLAEWCVEVTWQ
jgi:hypothetical protein